VKATTSTAVAVCIPAHGAPDGLQTLLDSLDRVTHERSALQVVVAVDGPDSALEKIARDAGVTVVVLPVNSGSYAARNAALDAVEPNVAAVLFTDTDCTVDADWVGAHLRALQTASASGGAVRVTTRQPPRAAEWVDANRHLRQQHFVESIGFAATCNLAVRRDVVDAVRFDPSLRSGGDYDFGVRLRAAGHRLVYTDDAIVRHPARTSTSAVLRKVARVARGAAVNQGRGHEASERRDAARLGSVRAAAAAGLPSSAPWRLHVRALDLACSVLYAWHVPSVVLPALRRRLART